MKAAEYLRLRYQWQPGEPAQVHTLDATERDLLEALDQLSAKPRSAKTGAAGMTHKSLTQVAVKNADRGEVSAIIATFGEVDSDGDVTLPGAFKDNGEFPISAYNHASWGAGALPVGVARVEEIDGAAILHGQFFMDTAAGRETFTTVKRLYERGLGEWSYGYDPVGAYAGSHKGRQVRFLPRQVVHEASPVLKGAGIGTRTLAAKSRTEPTDTGSTGMTVAVFRAAIRPHDTAVESKSWDPRAVLDSLGDSVNDLRAVHAWVDPDGDPEMKSSYRFPHHDGPGGPANVRACIAGIAALNGARGVKSIPAADVPGVYEHLASHLRDADREPPALRTGADGLKFNDEIAVTLVEFSALIDRAQEVVALRSAKQRSPLTPVSTELLSWLDEESLRLRGLLATPPDDVLAGEYLRYVAQQHRIGER